jgi:hypothetical protein
MVVETRVYVLVRIYGPGGGTRLIDEADDGGREGRVGSAIGKNGCRRYGCGRYGDRGGTRDDNGRAAGECSVYH